MKGERIAASLAYLRGHAINTGCEEQMNFYLSSLLKEWEAANDRGAKHATAFGISLNFMALLIEANKNDKDIH